MEKTISFNDAINELHDSIINENFTIFMGAGGEIVKCCG